LINLILSVVAMSYQEQQRKVEAENEELERRKIEDELELKSEDSRNISNAHALLHVDNEQDVENPNRKISCSGVSDELNNIRSRPMLQFDKSSLVFPNATISDTTSIPFLDETQPNTPNEERKSQRNQNNNDSIITVKRKYIFIFLF